jgi:hypothetical protein
VPFIRADTMERRIVEMVLTTLEKPDILNNALATYRAGLKSTAPAVNGAALKKKIAALADKQKMAARAKVEAMAAGQSTAVYDELLVEYSAERDALQAQVQAMAATRPVQPLVIEAGEIEAVRALLTCTDGSVLQSVKGDALRQVIASIVPDAAREMVAVEWRTKAKPLMLELAPNGDIRVLGI